MWLALILFTVNAIFMAGGFCWLAMNHFRSMGKRMIGLESEMKFVRRTLAWLKGRASVGQPVPVPVPVRRKR
jgi:hypothetical protein